MVDSTFMDGDEFTLDDLVTPDAANWPYDGERKVKFEGVHARYHELFVNVYDEDGQRIPFDEQRALQSDENFPNNLPKGYDAIPTVELVLKMVVDDPSLPEPDYPPTVDLQDARGVEINEDGTQFRFLDRKSGAPKLPSGQSTFARFLGAVNQNVPGFVKRFKKVAESEEKWFDAADFDGVEVIFGPVKVGRSSKYRAWPVGSVDQSSESAYVTPETAPEDRPTLQQLAAKAKTAKEYQNLVVQANLGDAKALAAVVSDPESAWAEAKA